MTESTQTSRKEELTGNRVRLAWVICGGILLALLLAGVVSNFASGSPDGLDSVTREGCIFNNNDEIVGGECAAQGATEHDLSNSPLSDYGVAGVDNSFLSTGLSGVIGVLVTLVIGFGVFALLRSRKQTEDVDADGR